MIIIILILEDENAARNAFREDVLKQLKKFREYVGETEGKRIKKDGGCVGGMEYPPGEQRYQVQEDWLLLEDWLLWLTWWPWETFYTQVLNIYSQLRVKLLSIPGWGQPLPH